MSVSTLVCLYAMYSTDKQRETGYAKPQRERSVKAGPSWDHSGSDLHLRQPHCQRAVAQGAHPERLVWGRAIQAGESHPPSAVRATASITTG